MREPKPEQASTNDSPSLIAYAISCMTTGLLFDFFCENGFFARAHHPPTIWQAVAALLSLLTYVVGWTTLVFAVNEWCELPRRLFAPERCHRPPSA